jgi:hypothetical protein
MSQVKFNFFCPEQFVHTVNGKWLPTEAVKFEFEPDGSVAISLAPSYHNALVNEQFWEPNNGKQIVYEGTLPL